MTTSRSNEPAPTTCRFVYIAAEKEWLGLLDDESLEERVRDQLIGLGFTSVSVDVFDPNAPEAVDG